MTNDIFSQPSALDRPAVGSVLETQISSPMIRLQEQIHRDQQLLESAFGMGMSRILEEGNRTRAMVASIARQSDAFRKTLEVSRSAFLPPDFQRATEFQRRLGEIGNMRAADLTRFSSPTRGLLASSFETLAAGRLLSATLLAGLDPTLLERVGRITHPWLDRADALSSVRRLAEIGSIGAAVGRIDAYGEDVSVALRGSLGDWRDADVGMQASSAVAERINLYVERGLHPDLTDFPEEAFEECLDALEIRDRPPPLLAVYDPPVPMNDEDCREGLDRANVAHAWLQAFETQFRRFVDERMTAAYGDAWPRSRLPNNMFERWLDKRSKDPNRDRHPRLVAYADFTDYEPVVTRADNFREVFAPYFGRVERFRESMARLALPRIEIAHSRIITQDDALFFYVELKRLSTQFGRNP